MVSRTNVESSSACLRVVFLFFLLLGQNGLIQLLGASFSVVQAEEVGAVGSTQQYRILRRREEETVNGTSKLTSTSVVSGNATEGKVDTPGNKKTKEKAATKVDVETELTKPKTASAPTKDELTDPPTKSPVEQPTVPPTKTPVEKETIPKPSSQSVATVKEPSKTKPTEAPTVKPKEAPTEKPVEVPQVVVPPTDPPATSPPTLTPTTASPTKNPTVSPTISPTKKPVKADSPPVSDETVVTPPTPSPKEPANVPKIPPVEPIDDEDSAIPLMVFGAVVLFCVVYGVRRFTATNDGNPRYSTEPLGKYQGL